MCNEDLTLTPEQESASLETNYDKLRTLAYRSLELARLVAANAACPHDLLKQLSELDDEEVKQNITSNPNTKPELLWRLGVYYPQALLANPIFDLLLLENPALFSVMPEPILLLLLYQKELPEIYRKLILKNKHRLNDATVLISVLRNHVEIWNQWRQDNQEIQISFCSSDLSNANLSGATLSNANLSGANLSLTNLTEADLSNSYLSDANLSEANLSEANLSEANLSGANLNWATLSKANLNGANLSKADFYKANLSEANLRRANLNRANLSKADLSGANFYKANLSKATLSGANLQGAELSRANLKDVNF